MGPKGPSEWWNFFVTNVNVILLCNRAITQKCCTFLDFRALWKGSGEGSGDGSDDDDPVQVPIGTKVK